MVGTDSPGTADDRLGRLAALGEPLRRALYRYVVSQSAPVSRDQAAAGIGVARHVAKFHLDKLAEDGLLTTDYQRPPGRTGPGAGRPAKLYSRGDREIAVSLPERRYDLAAQLMAEAIAASAASGTPVRDTLCTAARRAGAELSEDTRRRLGRRAGTGAVMATVCATLAEVGYEPRAEGRTVTLRNCPFHAVAAQHTELVCGMSLDVITGLLDELERAPVRAQLDPAPDRCCVTLTAVGRDER
jgi:predicted ArsR family transcriptional regulator